MILALHVPLALAVHSVPYVGLAHKVITWLRVLHLLFRGGDRAEAPASALYGYSVSLEASSGLRAVQSL